MGIQGQREKGLIPVSFKQLKVDVPSLLYLGSADTFVRVMEQLYYFSASIGNTLELASLCN